jgi:hypothetical protein
MAQGVLVFAEQVDETFRKIAFEALSEGRRLADTIGERLLENWENTEQTRSW